METAACKTPNSSDKEKGREGEWICEAKGGKFIGVRILHPHSPEQLQQAGWGSILENESRSLHIQLVVFWLYMKVLTIGVFPPFNFMSAHPHSAESNPPWMGFAHIHKCLAELGPMALMISVCEIKSRGAIDSWTKTQKAGIKSCKIS